MGVSHHTKYLETSRISKARWAANNREQLNAKRRQRRLNERMARLGDKKCNNCEALLVERLDWSPGRSKLYCRKCLSEHQAEVGRHKWRRYYYARLEENLLLGTSTLVAPNGRMDQRNTSISLLNKLSNLR